MSLDTRDMDGDGDIDEMNGAANREFFVEADDSSKIIVDDKTDDADSQSDAKDDSAEPAQWQVLLPVIARP